MLARRCSVYWSDREDRDDARVIVNMDVVERLQKSLVLVRSRRKCEGKG
jgi:hypothetical protein